MPVFAWFRRKATMSVAELREMASVSRKWGVPLLEHTDRSGWTVRVGDERKWGGK